MPTPCFSLIVLKTKKIKTKQKLQKTSNCHLVVFFPNAKGNALNNQPNAFFFKGLNKISKNKFLNQKKFE
jgi:hypothetical protein